MGLLETLGIDGPQAYENDAITNGLLALAQGGRKRPFLGLLQGLAAAQGTMNAGKDKERAQAVEALKMDLLRAQIGDTQAQELQRREAAAKGQRAQGMLEGLLNAPAQPNQYGTEGQGLSLAGVREQMTPRAGGLAGATLEDLLRVKAATGVNALDEWKIAQTGQKMDPGAYYLKPGQSNPTFLGDPSKGATVVNGSVQMMPNADRVLGALAGATKGAEAQATAPFTLIDEFRDGKPGKTTLADFLSRQGPPSSLPAVPPSGDPRSRAMSMAQADAVSGGQPVNYDLGGQRGSFAPSGGQGNFIQTGPSQRDVLNAEYDKGSQQDLLKRRTAIFDAAGQATENLNNYQRIGQLLAGHDGGKFSGTGLELARAANSMGLKVDKNLGNKEAAEALSNEIALTLRNPAGGAGMPGAMSDADREYLRSMVPSMSKSADGRRIMLDAATKVEQRKAEIASFARNYEKKYGRLDNGFFDQLSQWSSQNQLFGGQ